MTNDPEIEELYDKSQVIADEDFDTLASAIKCDKVTTIQHEHIDTKRLDHLMTVLWRSFPEVGLNSRDDIDKDMDMDDKPPFTIGSIT